MTVWRKKIKGTWVYIPEDLVVYTTVFEKDKYGYGTRMALFPEIDSSQLGFGKKFKHRVSHISRIYTDDRYNRYAAWSGSCRMEYGTVDHYSGPQPHRASKDEDAIIWLLCEPCIQEKYQKAYHEQKQVASKKRNKSSRRKV